MEIDLQITPIMHNFALFFGGGGAWRWDHKRVFTLLSWLVFAVLLPEGWGLLYWDGKRIYPVKAPQPFDNASSADIDILTSILRREEFPEKIFNYRGARTTIHPKTINGIVVR